MAKLGRPIMEIAGQKRGRLTIIRFAGINKKNGRSTWEAVCDCGNNTLADGYTFVKGLKKSCGCLLREKSKKCSKGHLRTPENTKFHGKSTAQRCAICLKDKSKKAYRRNPERFLKYSRENRGRFRGAAKKRLEKQRITLAPPYIRRLLMLKGLRSEEITKELVQMKTEELYGRRLIWELKRREIIPDHGDKVLPR